MTKENVNDLPFVEWIVVKLAEKGWKGFDTIEERKEIVDRACEHNNKTAALLYTEEQMKQIWENAFHGESFEECLQSLKQQ